MKLLITKVKFDERNASSDIDTYTGFTAYIPDWFIEKENIPKRHEMMLKRVTEKAMLFDIGDEEHWIPNSLVSLSVRNEKSLFDYACESDSKSPTPQ